MIVTWMEWSDRTLTMHENIPGKADATYRGTVKCLNDEEWLYSSFDKSVGGLKKTRQEAVEALMQGMNAKEIDSYDRGLWRP